MEDWDRTPGGWVKAAGPGSGGDAQDDQGLGFRALHKGVPGQCDLGRIRVPWLDKESPAVTLLCIVFRAKR